MATGRTIWRNWPHSADVSETYLSRMFHQQLGTTLTRYRNSLRLGRFGKSIAQPNSAIFCAPSMMQGLCLLRASFIRLFTQAYGRGPRACLKG